MTEVLRGEVVSVSAVEAGSSTTGPVEAGALSLPLMDVVDFDEAGGTVRLVLGDADELPAGVPSVLDVAYTGIVFAEDEEEPDDTPSVDALALASPLPFALDDEVPALVVDQGSGSVVREVVAEVLLEGESDDEPIEATIDHSLIPFLPEGMRDADGEAVELLFRGEDLYVVNIVNRLPVFDGSLIDPATLPPVDNTPTDVPASSPSLIVKGTADGLVVRTSDPVDVTSQIVYHIAKTVDFDGDGAPLPFEPSEATKIGSASRSSVVVITELPNGERLSTSATYYLRAVATNVVGDAVAGALATGKLDPSVVSELAVASVTAGFALLGAMQVGQITIHPDSGITVPTPKGEIRLPADGTPATFSGSVHTDDLTVESGFTLNGRENAVNGTLTLANVIVPPSQAPTLGQKWDYSPPIGTDTWSLAEGISSSEWISVNFTTNTFKRFSKATGVQVASYGPYTNWRLFGAVAIGSTYYLIARQTVSPDETYVLRVSSAGALLSTFKVGTSAEVGGVSAIGKTLDGRLMVAWSHTDATNVRVKTYSTAGVLAASELWDYATGTSASGVRPATNVALAGVGESPTKRDGTSQRFVVVDTIPFFLNETTKRTDWWAGRPDGLKGMTWGSDERLHFLAFNTYRVYEYTRTYWDAPVTVGHTWFDSDASSPGGTHETTLSPTASFTPWHWTKLTVSTPAPADNGNPDDPDSIRVYFNGHRQPEVAPGVTSASFSSLVESGLAAPTVNGFESAAPNPGRIESASQIGGRPLFEVLGNGSGRWGGLEVNAVGKTVLNGDSGWVAVTEFGLGWENYGSQFAPAAYRKVGSLVYLRGLVRSGPVATPIFTLPSGFRPPYSLLLTGVSNSVSQALTLSNLPAKTLTTTSPNNASEPSHKHDVTVTAYTTDGTVTIPSIPVRLNVNAAGTVVVGSAAAATGFISLDGISFFVD